MLHDHFAIRDVIRSKSSIPPPHLSSPPPRRFLTCQAKEKQARHFKPQKAFTSFQRRKLLQCPLSLSSVVPVAFWSLYFPVPYYFYDVWLRTPLLTDVINISHPLNSRKNVNRWDKIRHGRQNPCIKPSNLNAAQVHVSRAQLPAALIWAYTTVDAQKARTRLRSLLIGQGTKNLTAVTFYFTVDLNQGCHGDRHDKVQLFYCLFYSSKAPSGPSVKKNP